MRGLLFLLLILYVAPAMGEDDWMAELFPDNQSLFSTPFLWDTLPQEKEPENETEWWTEHNPDVDPYDQYWAEKDKEYIREQTSQELVVTICDYDREGFLYCYDL